MLSQLYIKNIAVISEATIDFTTGLNVFTGETGAGKTILIHAINAVLGERASKDMIRTGEEKASISALFTNISVSARQALEEAGYPSEDDSVLIFREISADGKSVCKINGRPANVSILKEISACLINVHGQHDNQQLLSSQKHLGFIDSFGELEPLLSKYQEKFYAYTAAKDELEQINTDETMKARQIELLNYQISEIEDANLQPGEEEELRAQRKLIQNSLTVTQALGTAVAILDGEGESESLTSMMGFLRDNVEDAAKYLEAASPASEKLSDLFYELEAVSSDLHDLLEGFDCDPSQLDAIERRLDVIYQLKKKYGPDVESILRFYDEAATELDSIQTSDKRAAELEEAVTVLEKEAVAIAQQLSAARQESAKQFVAAVQDELVFLDMPSVSLSVRRQEKPLSTTGTDDIELFLSTNIGESEKSLAKIASGGELSRIMLSIKNVLAGKDEIGTLIFDEVDTGVSGRAAGKIGRKLRQVADSRQVIVVTHLAQVACFAQNHLLISKTAKDNRTFTSITPLDPEGRVQELARIIGGENASEIALEHAREMLREAEN